MQMTTQVTQIFVRPGGARVLIESGLRMHAVPAESEAVPICAGGGFKRGAALSGERVLRFRYVVFKRGGQAAICDPATHKKSRVRRVPKQSAPRGQLRMRRRVPCPSP